VELWKGKMILAVYGSARQVLDLRPDFRALQAIPDFGVITTAPGDDCDFVSRFFAPNAGIDEDPVTGSAHCVLTPYWAKRLGRTRLTARQVSARGGELWCEDRGERVSIGGHAVLYLEGQIHVP
jgi:predicted PhzF superfamily epimerase YddE/YHI9